jgi:hypothetical protein
MKRKLINVSLGAMFIALLGLMIYFVDKDDKVKSNLYGVKIHGTISDMRYTEKVEYLADGTISFIDYETNRRYHVATEYIVIGPRTN